MKQRVVITGMGVVAPNGVGLENFLQSLKSGKSGIKHYPELEKMNFSCQIGGIPDVNEEMAAQYFDPLMMRGFNSPGILYGCMSGIDAWRDAGLDYGKEMDTDWDSGVIFGIGNSSAEKFRESIYKVDEGQVRRLGSSTVLQIMASGISAYLGGILGLGNIVTTNSSACCTGTESIIMAYERIKAGKAKRILAGSCSDHGPYIWGGFDALKVMNYKSNGNPEAASNPMSTHASGFVPGSGAGAMVLESLESALERGVRIYGEVIGGHLNSGGQRNGGTLTAPNSEGVRKCITATLVDANIHADEIDAINGHLTATSKDPDEIESWTVALGRKGNDFPYINSLKSLTGHCLSASGAIESVATVLQIYHNFLFPNINCEDIHPKILELISQEKIVRDPKFNLNLNVVFKSSFGFGDVNACVLFQKYPNNGKKNYSK